MIFVPTARIRYADFPATVNGQRATHGQKMICGDFAEIADDDERRCAIIDGIADLLHFAQLTGVDVDDLTETAMKHFEIENDSDEPMPSGDSSAPVASADSSAYADALATVVSYASSYLELIKQDGEADQAEAIKELGEAVIFFERKPILKAVVEISGGVAEVTSCPPGVEVEIVDHDNEKNG